MSRSFGVIFKLFMCSWGLLLLLLLLFFFINNYYYYQWQQLGNSDFGFGNFIQQNYFWVRLLVYFCCGLGLRWIKFQSGLYCDRLGCWLMSVRAWLFGLKGKWNWTNLQHSLHSLSLPLALYKAESSIAFPFSISFSQFGHVLDVYLSKVKVSDLYLVQLGMVTIVSQ